MVDEKKQVPFMPGLWTVKSSGEARLAGSRCQNCEELYFPVKTTGYCPHCYAEQMQDVDLGPSGTLAAYTTVLQAPAGGFYHGSIPFSYGLVDLDEGVRVEVHLGGDPATYRVGSRMTLKIEPFYTNEQGEGVQVFRFVPVEGGAA